MFRADLHMHSAFSDGTLTPQELIQKAKMAGVSGISITDHDCVDAYEGLNTEGFLVGTGVEISSTFQGGSIHVLAYNFDPSAQEIQAYCQGQKARREERCRQTLEKLSSMRMPMTLEEVRSVAPQSRVLGRPHIAEAMRRRGYVRSFKEAFQLYLAEGKPAYFSSSTLSTEEALHLIHRIGGKAFIAHPHLLKPSVLNEICLYPFQGIECYYARPAPHDEERFFQLAKRNKWLVSGGSDFHAEGKGGAIGSCFVREEAFFAIFPALKVC